MADLREEVVPGSLWPQLNDARPRIHGQVVLVVMKIIQGALLQQVFVDGLLENPLEVFLGLLVHVYFLVLYLVGQLLHGRHVCLLWRQLRGQSQSFQGLSVAAAEDGSFFLAL